MFKKCTVLVFDNPCVLMIYNVSTKNEIIKGLVYQKNRYSITSSAILTILCHLRMNNRTGVRV